MSLFSDIRITKPKRNAFDLSHEVKLTCDMGELIPFLCEEVVPGDTFRVTTEQLVRFAPMIAPIMHRVDVYTHFFFVPNRLIWDDWEDFITKGVDGTDAPVHPYMTVAATRLADPTQIFNYFGLGSSGESSVGLRISALPVRAYGLIWNEFYRDQNVMNELAVPRTSGEDIFGNWYPLTNGRVLPLRRSWQKDYFTSALPWVQRGPDVTLPLGGQAPVNVYDAAGNPTMPGLFLTQALNSQNVNMGAQNNTSGMVRMGQPSADLSEATSTTVNELRRSIALQRWAETAARAGSRYIEQIFAFFGVKSSDARLQRPEYLGGGRSPVMVSEVLQTSQSTSSSPQANMSGHGISAGSSHQFKKYFEEHGLIIGILSVLPKTGYFQGIPKKFLRQDNMDYYFPTFAHLGEQPILNKELYATGNSAMDNNTFGYTPRYAEYKTCQDRVCGEFRTNLNFWHLARQFGSLPVLNQSFIQSDPSTRIFAVEGTTSDHLWIQIYNKITAIRPMPKYGTPGLHIM